MWSVMWSNQIGGLVTGVEACRNCTSRRSDAGNWD